MDGAEEYSCRMRIENPLGFHVRPVQRFAELANAFEADITVAIDGRQASGKSVMGLMSLGGRCGAEMDVRTRGEDARQALEVIRYLVQSDFFVEDDVLPGERPRRHIERLQKLASCFESRVRVAWNGRTVDLDQAESMEHLDFPPTATIDCAVEGCDERQARQVLDKLIAYKFYVEDAMDNAQA